MIATLPESLPIFRFLLGFDRPLLCRSKPENKCLFLEPASPGHYFDHVDSHDPLSGGSR